MIGLEYIIGKYKVQQKNLAEELGINKQNITLWIKQRQNIPAKYLPLLSKKFDLPEECFQKELTEVDRIFIEKRQLEDYIEASAEEFVEPIWDNDVNDYIEVTKKQYDIGAIETHRKLTADEHELEVVNKIRKSIHNLTDINSFDEFITIYEDKICIYNRFAEIVDGNEKRSFLHQVIRAMELFFEQVLSKSPSWQGSPLLSNEDLETEKPLVQELYKVFRGYCEKMSKEEKEHIELTKECEDLDDLF